MFVYVYVFLYIDNGYVSFMFCFFFYSKKLLVCGDIFLWNLDFGRVWCSLLDYCVIVLVFFLIVVLDMYVLLIMVVFFFCFSYFIFWGYDWKYLIFYLFLLVMGLYVLLVNDLK